LDKFLQLAIVAFADNSWYARVSEWAAIVDTQKRNWYRASYTGSKLNVMLYLAVFLTLLTIPAQNLLPWMSMKVRGFDYAWTSIW